MDDFELFAGLGGADAQGRRPKYDQDGNFKARIDAIKLVESFETKSLSYVIETTCTASDNPSIRVGQPRSITINRLDSRKNYEKESALGNLKGFLTAAVRAKYGANAEAALAAMDQHGPRISAKTGEPETPDEKWANLGVLSKANDGEVFKGYEVEFNVTKVTTKNSKKPGEPGYDPTKLFPKVTFVSTAA